LKSTPINQKNIPGLDDSPDESETGRTSNVEKQLCKSPINGTLKGLNLVKKTLNSKDEAETFNTPDFVNN
jgi:hypothetical protein